MAEKKSKRTSEKAPRNLVIVESPGKIKALSRYLGSGYRVMASLGHVRDLPKSRLAIDIDGGFAPEYIVPKGKTKLVKDLRSAVNAAETVYLAPDPDREGEAIAWHLQELLKSGDTPFFRIAYQEITQSAVREALEHPGEINLRKVDAQTARRVMDRLMGYKISPLLWKKVASGLSAGRVQSVALLLVCRREEEIREFRPEEYWLLDARFSKPDTGESFWARLEKVDGRKARVEDGESASGLEEEVRRAVHKVARVEEKERAKAPPLPFITSSLQLEAARRFRWTVSRTMKVAQSLYEGVELGRAGVVGLITYMRTDSYRISADALRHAREYIADAFGSEYLPAQPRVYRARQGAQDAHEAIRPTDFSITPEQAKEWLPPDQARLYALIWRRTIAGQMASARLATVTVAVESGRCEFVARRERVVFPGYLKVWEPDGETGPSEEADSREPLPPLKPGEELALAETKKEQKFTQPPARYSEGTLVKALESNGVGRPSTYAPTVSTLLKRRYVEKKERKLVPTDLGMMVNGLLQEYFPSVLNIKFTAQMEKELDEIEEGRFRWHQVVSDFFDPFQSTLQQAEKGMENLRRQALPTDIVCENCGRKMMIRWGRNGEYLACENYPECRTSLNFDRAPDGTIVPRRPETTDEVCEKCGAPMVVKQGRYGKFLACSGYPACKNTRPVPTSVKCPREGCGGVLVQRRSKKGYRFYGCSRYPECDFVTRRLPVSEEKKNPGKES